jgi:hypothetical protein
MKNIRPMNGTIRHEIFSMADCSIAAASRAGITFSPFFHLSAFSPIIAMQEERNSDRTVGGGNYTSLLSNPAVVDEKCPVPPRRAKPFPMHGGRRDSDNLINNANGRRVLAYGEAAFSRCPKLFPKMAPA